MINNHKLYHNICVHTGDNKIVVEMRDHPCFCIECSQRNYANCPQKITVGSWKATSMSIKAIPKVFETVPVEIQEITKFYYGAILQGEDTFIVGLVMKNNIDGSKHLKLGTLAVPPKINKKEAISQELHVEKLQCTVYVPKGAAVIRVKLLVKHPNIPSTFYLNHNTKVVTFPVTDLTCPSEVMYSDPFINRRNYIRYSTTESTQNNALQIRYEIEESCMEWLLSRITQL